jgi:hypothetical protein
MSVVDHSDLDFGGNLTNSTFSLDDVYKVFQENNLNMTSLKNYFIKAFHDHLYESHVKKKLPFLTKFYRKLDSSLSRFKRRFVF